MTDRNGATHAAHDGGVFRAILWKELREGLKPAAIGFVVIAVGLAFSLMVQRSSLSGNSSGPTGDLSLFTLTTLFAGAMIGRSQMRRERRGDRWGFLTQRPVSRSTLFAGKALAGVMLHIVAAGIPLACMAVWLATPNHMGMPFDARMILPGMADLLIGFVAYFAALLVTMRDARWYASRWLGIAVAFYCSFFVVTASTFWLALAAVAVGLVVAGTAAWGTFIRGGNYETQPTISRAAVGVATTAGITVVTSMAFGALSLFMAGSELFSSHLVVTEQSTDDGQVVQTIEVPSTTAHFPDSNLVIAQVIDKHGHLMALFPDSTVRLLPPLPITGYDESPNRGYRGTDEVFVRIAGYYNSDQDTRFGWYYINRLGLIAEYEYKSARLIGWMGPDGFTVAPARPARRFDGPLGRYAGAEYLQHVLAFPNAVYHYNRDERTIEKIFTPPPGERVVSAVGDGESEYTWHLTAIATDKRIYVLARDSTPEFSVPLDPKAATYRTITMFHSLRAPGQPYFAWYQRDQFRATTSEIIEYSGGGSVLARYTVPRDTGSVEGESARNNMITEALLDPVATRATRWSYAKVAGAGHARVQPQQSNVVRIGAGYARMQPQQFDDFMNWPALIVVSLLTAIIAFVLARAYAFPARRLWLWTVLCLLFGPLAVLVMLSVIEWPVREVCPACQRKRVVTRERCEHCDAPFPPPVTDGTEIFEVAATAS